MITRVPVAAYVLAGDAFRAVIAEGGDAGKATAAAVDAAAPVIRANERALIRDAAQIHGEGWLLVRGELLTEDAR